MRYLFSALHFVVVLNATFMQNICVHKFMRNLKYLWRIFPCIFFKLTFFSAAKIYGHFMAYFWYRKKFLLDNFLICWAKIFFAQKCHLQTSSTFFSVEVFFEYVRFEEWSFYFGIWWNGQKKMRKETLKLVANFPILWQFKRTSSRNTQLSISPLKLRSIVGSSQVLTKT